MKLINIDKTRYRKHLNIVIVMFIASLLVLSLAFGTLLIHGFSHVSPMTDVAQNTATAIQQDQPDNFKFNLLGVILALLINSLILYKVKNSAFFTEIYYVWQVKQLQNLIYRKLKKIKLAAKEGEEIALTILSFYYESQLQIYQLDDNTITLSSIEKHKQEVNELIEKHELTIDIAHFSKKMLASY